MYLVSMDRFVKYAISSFLALSFYLSQNYQLAEKTKKYQEFPIYYNAYIKFDAIPFGSHVIMFIVTWLAYSLEQPS